VILVTAGTTVAGALVAGATVAGALVAGAAVVGVAAVVQAARVMAIAAKMKTCFFICFFSFPLMNLDWFRQAQ
jgi:hypothetical protein